MIGKSHIIVANPSLAFLNQEERHILFPRWGGIESSKSNLKLHVIIPKE